MDFKEMKVGDVLAIMEIFKQPQQASCNEKHMIGEFVIVRCKDAGVHAGTLISYEGREVVLKDSKRLWYWKAKKQHTLSGVAVNGVSSDSKITDFVDKVVLPEFCEIISCTKEAEESIKEAKAYDPE